MRTSETSPSPEADFSVAHTIGKVLVDLDQVALFHCGDSSAGRRERWFLAYPPPLADRLRYDESVNRKDFQFLARTRLAEAKALLAAGHPDGA